MNRAGRRRGMALALVLVFVTMIAATAALAARRTVAVVRLNEGIARREADFDERSRRRLALAYGLALLETGDPPVAQGQQRYSCRAIITTADVPGELSYVLQFENAGDNRWRVSARRWDGISPPNLPPPAPFRRPGP